MADIVYAFGASHGPLLSTPPHEWDLRANVDRKNPELAYRDGTYNFAELAALRKADGFEKQNTLEVRTERWNRCQAQLDELSRRTLAQDIDALVIVGDDQHEWFFPDTQPTFAIYHGKEVFNRALSEKEKEEIIGRGGAYSMKVYFPPQDEIYPTPVSLSEAMIARAMDEGFDVTACATQPQDAGVPRKLGHAYGFIYRRILNSKPIPLVPILINTFFPPNQPTPKRCFEFGRSLGRAIAAWEPGKRVAVAASGGVSHFVVDEDFDNRILNAMLKNDWETICKEPQIMFRSGTSETKNWIVMAGIIAETKLKMELLDYVPCYRSEAGTGSGMAFATWQ
jgi:hypothetical protein